ncbi:MAG: cysteine synthase [Rickettsiales bacterium]|nr:cysteine synthase [Rickettsiales bacterium]
MADSNARQQPEACPWEGQQDPFAGATGLLTRVGGTPLVKLRRVGRDRLGTAVELFLKLESFNPSGSVKARAALAIVLDARRRGLLRDGVTLLDASSGNTGIAYALISATLGYPLCLCLPANASIERKRLLRAYGVEVVETDPLEGSDGAILEARRRAAEQPDRYCYLDQYNNPWNWRAHYASTGPELWRQTDGGITHLVASLGTSGTFVGTARFLRAINPEVRCVAVQPDSPFHGIEGLKHMETSLVPGIWDESSAHQQLAVPTEPALQLVGELAREEGLLVGSSTGAALYAALQLGAELSAGQIVVVSPDSGERYLSEEHLWNRS